MTKKVIIIDDSITSLNFLKNHFAANDWEVISLKDATNAIKSIYDNIPDLIITDALMPIMGGFKLIKKIRNDDKICNIPIIVYSILDEKNAKFYIDKNRKEYFLQKNDNIDELLELSEKIIKDALTNESYKSEPIKNKENQLIQDIQQIEILTLETPNIQKEEEQKNPKTQTKYIDKTALENKLNKILNLNYDNEKTIKEIFCLLFSQIKYDLFTIAIKSLDTIYFDIKEVIISPIFQNAILKKYNLKNVVLYKKYSPNLIVYKNEKDFIKKIEFNITTENNNSIDIAIYSKDENKQELSDENIQTIKELLYNFFNKYKFNKKTASNKSNSKNKNYPKYIKVENSNDLEAYFALIEISNLSQIIENFDLEEQEENLDIISSKISEKIINYLGKDEQIYKINDEEYNVIIFAPNEKNAIKRFELIISLLNTISYNSINIEAKVGAIKYEINNESDYKKALDLAESALNLTTTKEKTVILNAK